MPRASYRILKDWFVNHLQFTPTSGDIAKFEEDLAVVSPSLMKASLVELSQGRSRYRPRPQDWRLAIFAVYNRKVAEHAQLFPVFHCFETAFRSMTAVTLEEHYAIPKWWEPVRLHVYGGPQVTSIGAIANVTAPRLRAIRLLVQELSTTSAAKLMSAQDGYELLDASRLGQVKRLIEEHWPLFRGKFVRNGLALAPTSFTDKFQRMIDARNAVYHHNSFAGLQDTYTNAADLLDYINFRLPRVHKSITQSGCTPPPYF